MGITRKIGVLGRLCALVLIAVLGIFVMEISASRVLGNATMDLKKEELIHLTDIAMSITERYYAQSESGAMSVENAQRRALEEISLLRYENGNYFWINDSQMVMIAHGVKPELVGHDQSDLADPNGVYIFREMVAAVQESNPASVNYQWTAPGAAAGDAPIDKIAVIQHFEPWDWIIGTGAYLDFIEATVASAHRSMNITLVVLAIIMAISATLIAYCVINPIRRLTNRMSMLSEGDTETEIPYRGDNTVFGEISEALSIFQAGIVEREEMQEKEKLRLEEERKREIARAEEKQAEAAERHEAEKRAQEERSALERAAAEEKEAMAQKAREAERAQEQARMRADEEKRQMAEKIAREMEKSMKDQAQAVQKLAEVLAALAKGDLSAKVLEELPESYDVLRKDFNLAVDNLSDALNEVVSASQGIDQEIVSLNRVSEQLSSDTERNAAAVEETASALEQMTATVRELATGAEHISTTSQSARVDVEGCEKMVEDVVAAMENIQSSSSSISSIIGMIDEIAFQTNLLALNAGVEAARAGDAGRGFAVVASEVGVLAQRSSEAAREISELIGQGASEVKNGVDLVESTRTALRSVLGSVRSIGEQVDSMSTSSREQAAAIAEINNSVSSIDSATQQTVEQFRNMNAATEKLEDESRHLTNAVGQFRLPYQRPDGMTSAA